jgi:hypothetical protein
MVPFSNLLAALQDVTDPRRAQGQPYPLAPLLLFTVLALLSGAKSYCGIITFLDQCRVLLNHYFRITSTAFPWIDSYQAAWSSL